MSYLSQSNSTFSGLESVSNSLFEIFSAISAYTCFMFSALFTFQYSVLALHFSLALFACTAGIQNKMNYSPFFLAVLRNTTSMLITSFNNIFRGLYISSSKSPPAIITFSQYFTRHFGFNTKQQAFFL